MYIDITNRNNFKLDIPRFEVKFLGWFETREIANGDGFTFSTGTTTISRRVPLGVASLDIEGNETSSTAESGLFERDSKVKRGSILHIDPRSTGYYKIALCRNFEPNPNDLQHLNPMLFSHTLAKQIGTKNPENVESPESTPRLQWQIDFKNPHTGEIISQEKTIIIAEMESLPFCAEQIHDAESSEWELACLQDPACANRLKQFEGASE